MQIKITIYKNNVSKPIRITYINCTLQKVRDNIFCSKLRCEAQNMNSIECRQNITNYQYMYIHIVLLIFSLSRSSWTVACDKDNRWFRRITYARGTRGHKSPPRCRAREQSRTCVLFD